MKKLLLIILILLPFNAFSSVYTVLKHPIDENPLIQELARHSSMVTTQRYIDVSDDKLKNAVNLI